LLWKDNCYNAIVAFCGEHYSIMEKLKFELIFEINEENVEYEDRVEVKLNTVSFVFIEKKISF
jgi:hypothetical protein